MLLIIGKAKLTKIIDAIITLACEFIDDAKGIKTEIPKSHIRKEATRLRETVFPCILNKREASINSLLTIS